MSSSKAGQLNSAHSHNRAVALSKEGEKECLSHVHFEYRQLRQALNDGLGMSLMDISKRQL